MMRNKKAYLFLLGIVIVAGILRMHSISIIPPSLSWDEVSIGYNAYSILKTGRDEHGRFFPLDAFAAYGDYKPPLAVYLTVPSVALFGLNEFSVRFPAALFGTLTVLLTYFLVQSVFSLRKNRIPEVRYMAIISTALLAVSPWHINLSRAGFEATIALFFTVLGIYFILKTRTKPSYWIVAWIPYVCAIYTFNSARYFVPLMGAGCVIAFWKTIRNNLRPFLIGICIAGLLMMPIIPHLVSKEARLRFVEVNIFSDISVVQTANERSEESKNAWWAKILHNRRIGYMRSYALHFLDHFQPEYLFVKGDGNPKFSIQDVGQLYMIEAPFLIIGMILMYVYDIKIALFLAYWIVCSIIPAAVARETPHALRTMTSLPTWQICIAYGSICAAHYVSKFTIRKQISIGAVFLWLIIILYGASIMYYLHEYYVHYPKEFSGEWQYGYKQAIAFITPSESAFDTVYMTTMIGRPYMYMLFYKKTDPNEFFRTKDASFDAAGFYHVYGFGKYRFVSDITGECQGKCLYMVPSGGEMKDGTLLTTIHLLNGNPVLDIYEK